MRAARPHRLLRLAPAALLAGAALAACGLSSVARQASVHLSAARSGSGVLMRTDGTGSGALRQVGDQLTVSTTVSGLAPGSRHAEVVHGPFGYCKPNLQVPDVAVILPDLVVGANGTAHASLRTIVNTEVVEKGYYLTVLHGPTPTRERSLVGSAPTPAYTAAMASNVPMLCGNLGPVSPAATRRRG
ncbi:MAG TPA: hypothetical protein VHX88_00220 [Solirubrobacteraceae bacterium]|nr:hypothetical protein [Solirubrobacteraceae bacterium]